MAGLVAHTRFRKLNLHRIIRMADDFGDCSIATRVYLAVYPLAEVETATEEFPAPAFVADAVLPEGVAGEWGVRLYTVADEAARSVGIEAK